MLVKHVLKSGANSGMVDFIDFWPYLTYSSGHTQLRCGAGLYNL